MTIKLAMLFWCFFVHIIRRYISRSINVTLTESKNQIFLFTQYKCLIKYRRSFTLTFLNIYSDSNKNSMYSSYPSPNYTQKALKSNIQL
uniref:Secreted protein n=1 Tax=Anguilla anguilla TaxID=7936 RepID=A0A0E9XZP0_ANGAN